MEEIKINAAENIPSPEEGYDKAMEALKSLDIKLRSISASTKDIIGTLKHFKESGELEKNKSLQGFLSAATANSDSKFNSWDTTRKSEYGNALDSLNSRVNAFLGDFASMGATVSGEIHSKNRNELGEQLKEEGVFDN
jgi:uncharacterized protein YjgD (DUF1641 family)